MADPITLAESSGVEPSQTRAPESGVSDSGVPTPPASKTARAATRYATAIVLFGALFLAMGGVGSIGVWISALAVGLTLSSAAIGVYLTFRVLDFPDLTVEGSFALGGAVTGLMMTNGYSPFATLPAAFTASALAGLLTGVIATRLKIHSLLASIIVTTGLFSINLRILGRSNLPLLSEGSFLSPFQEGFKGFIRGALGDDQVRYANNLLAIIMVGCFVVVIKLLVDWFMASELGTAMRASGDSPQMMRALGRNTNSYIIFGVGLANGLTGLAGSLASQFQGFSDVNQGLGLIIGGLAAVVIGETIFRPRTLPQATAAVVGGMLIYRLAVAAALTINFGGFRFDAADVKFVTAALLLITLASSRVSRLGGQ